MYTQQFPRMASGSGREIARALRAAYLGLHRQTNACLARAGITADQFVLLAALADGDAVTQQELVRRTFSDPSTVRAMLVLLQARGLIARRRHAADSRARCVTLTRKGRRAFNRMWKMSESVRARLLAAFGADEVPALIALLCRIAEAMHPPPGGGTRKATGGGRRRIATVAGNAAYDVSHT